MTDRHAGYLVTLESDIREDDAEETLTAPRMVRGVTSVKPLVGEWQVGIAEERRDGRWRDALLALVRNGPATQDQ